jgi:predicted DNA-binding protein
MKINKKDKTITIRLTPNQQFELASISKELETSKSKLLRSIIDEFLKNYNQ